MNAAYRLIAHTADAGMQVTAADPRSLFTEAGLARAGLLAAATHPCEGRVCQVALEGADWTDLMVNWLRELLYLFNGRERLVREIVILHLEARRIEARLACDHFDPCRHAAGPEIKAVTYHQARVSHDTAGWTARIIFDL